MFATITAVFDIKKVVDITKTLYSRKNEISKDLLEESLKRNSKIERKANKLSNEIIKSLLLSVAYINYSKIYDFYNEQEQAKEYILKARQSIHSVKSISNSKLDLIDPLITDIMLLDLETQEFIERAESHIYNEINKDENQKYSKALTESVGEVYYQSINGGEEVENGCSVIYSKLDNEGDSIRREDLIMQGFNKSILPYEMQQELKILLNKYEDIQTNLINQSNRIRKLEESQDKTYMAEKNRYILPLPDLFREVAENIVKLNFYIPLKDVEYKKVSGLDILQVKFSLHKVNLLGKLNTISNLRGNFIDYDLKMAKKKYYNLYNISLEKVFPMFPENMYFKSLEDLDKGGEKSLLDVESGPDHKNNIGNKNESDEEIPKKLRI